MLSGEGFVDGSGGHCGGGTPLVSAYVEDHEGEAIDFSKILTRSLGLMP